MFSKLLPEKFINEGLPLTPAYNFDSTNASCDSFVSNIYTPPKVLFSSLASQCFLFKPGISEKAVVSSEAAASYSLRFIPDKLKLAKKDALIMHPGPMNRGVEIDTKLADDINVSLVKEQVELGVAVRMACLKLYCK